MSRLALAVLLAGCGPKVAPPGVVPTDLPVDGVKYLNSWLVGKGSPQDALGRFVEEAAESVDASSGSRTACSEWFERVELPAPSQAARLIGGTPEAGALAGVPAGQEAVLFPAFAPDKRVAAVIKDPRGLATCCEERLGECTTRYIGEVLEGEGRLYRLDRSQGEPRWFDAGKASGPYSLRLLGNPYAGPECGSWRQDPPRAAKGTYVLGVSTATRSEENARADALRQARHAALTWLKERSLGDSHLQRMTEERWCFESFPGESGQTEWLAHVLMYLPAEAP